jgi:EmrB/QacA subfamily drug resistance transporter
MARALGARAWTTMGTAMNRSASTLTLAAMCLGTFMAILDTSLVNLGLHAIQADLAADLATLQWVIDLYNLAYAIFILSGGVLADRYGRRRIFLLGTAIFALGSALCAVAWDAPALILGRFVTGVGAAFALPAALAILALAFPDARERTRAIAIWGAMNGLAMAIGPTLGGLLVDALGWRSLFAVILPVAAATYALAAHAVAETTGGARPLDIRGQILAMLALLLLCVGVIEGPRWGWDSPATFACLAGAALCAVAFVVAERTAADPMLPLDMFANRAFSAAIADASLMTYGVYGLLFLLPLYLQALRGTAATTAGVILLPLSLTFFVASPVAGRIATRVGPRRLIGAGMTLNGCGLLALTFLADDTGMAVIVAALLAVGLGLGLITGPISTAAVANAPAARSGTASGALNVARMVGATLGVAVIGALFGAGPEQAITAVPHFLAGAHATFAIGGAAELLGAVIAVLCFRRDSLGRPHEAASIRKPQHHPA